MKRERLTLTPLLCERVCIFLAKQPRASQIFAHFLAVTACGDTTDAVWIHAPYRMIATTHAVGLRTAANEMRYLLEHRFLLRDSVNTTYYTIPISLCRVGHGKGTAVQSKYAGLDTLVYTNGGFGEPARIHAKSPRITAPDCTPPRQNQIGGEVSQTPPQVT